MPTLSRTYSITSSVGPQHKVAPLLRPDGGWGWAIVVGSFFISFITDGFSYTSGVLYEKFLNVYGESESVTSMFTALMTGLISVMGPISAGLSETYGCRAVTVAGALIASISMALSVVFDSSIHYHTVTLGLGVGSGLGLMFLPQVTIVTDWFDKKISLATGLAVCGSGFGMAVFAFFSNEMFNRYDWHDVMLGLAAVMFLCAFFALTFSPPPASHQSLEAPNKKKKGSSASAVASSADGDKLKTFKKAVHSAFNFRLLRDVPFLYLILSNSFGCLVYYIPFIITTDRMVRNGFGDTTDGAILMVYFGISNGFSRPLAGYISDYKWINRTILYGCSVFAMGVIVAGMTFASSLAMMNFLYVLLGIADGIHACLGTVILVDEFGAERVYNAYGILLMFDGTASIIGPPLINFLTVIDKSYTTSLLACAAILSIAGFLCAIFPYLPFRKRTENFINHAKSVDCSISTVSSNDQETTSSSNHHNNDNNNHITVTTIHK